MKYEPMRWKKNKIIKSIIDRSSSRKGIKPEIIESYPAKFLIINKKSTQREVILKVFFTIFVSLFNKGDGTPLL